MRNDFNKYCLVAADFETTAAKELTQEEILNQEMHGHTVLAGANSKMFLCGIKSLKTKEYRLSYENMEDLFNNLWDMAQKEHKAKVMCWFHNLAFDGSYILHYLLSKGYTQTLNTDKFGQPLLLYKQFSMLAAGGKFFNIKITWKCKTIEFYDSLKFLQAPLAKLGEEMLNLPKLKETVDYSKFEISPDHQYPDDWLIYLKRDVDILEGCINKFIDAEPHFTPIRQTSSSIAYSYIQKEITSRTPKWHIKDYFAFEPFYIGGLCQPSRLLNAKWVKAENKIRMIDKCSMYPSMMIQKMPYGHPSKTISPKWDSYCTFYKIHINKAVIKEKYNSIACIWKPFYIHNGLRAHTLKYAAMIHQYLQEVENEDYYITDIELDMWKQLYDIDYKIIDQWYFATAEYLAPVIKRMFKDKQDASRKHNKTMKLLAKLKINGVYGKTGQHPIKTQAFYGKEAEIGSKYVKKGNITGNPIYEGINIERVKEETACAKYIVLASYITSKARVDLLSKIKAIIDAGNTFLYCDTDSVCFIENNPISDADIGDELGCWEYEDFDRATYFCSLAPKQYRICYSNGEIAKTACAGLDKEVIKKVENIDYNYDLGENPKYNIYKKTLKTSFFGKVIVEGVFNFKKWKKINKNPIWGE